MGADTQLEGAGAVDGHAARVQHQQYPGWSRRRKRSPFRSGCASRGIGHTVALYVTCWS